MKSNFASQATVLACLVAFQTFANPGDALNRKNRMPLRLNFRPIRGRRDDTLDSLGENLDKYSRYFAFNFSTGRSMLNVLPGKLTIGFAYSSSSQNQLEFHNTIRLPRIEVPIQTYSFGFESGRTQGFFWGMNMTFFDSTFPSNKFGDNISLEFKLGANININDNLSFRPAILLDYNSLFVRSSEWIDNRNTDITALGHFFPYRHIVYSKYGSRTVYNNYIDVGFHEQSGLFRLQGELSYKVNPAVRLTFGMGYCMNFSQTESIQLRGASNVDVPLNLSGLDFTSSVPTNKIFDYKGLYWNVGVSFTFPTKNRHHCN